MVNKVQLIGRVGKDTETRVFDNGDRVANFSLATSETWKDKDGNKKEQTEWHQIVMRNEKADLAEKYIKKGMQLYLEGKIKYGSYEDKEGNKKYFTQIICYVVQFLSKPTENDNVQAGTTPVQNEGNPEDESGLPF